MTTNTVIFLIYAEEVSDNGDAVPHKDDENSIDGACEPLENYKNNGNKQQYNTHD